MGEPDQGKSNRDKHHVTNAPNRLLASLKDHARHQAAGSRSHACQNRFGIGRRAGMEVDES